MNLLGKIVASTTLLIMPIMLFGCASTSVTPLAANTILISTSVESACGGQSAQRLAYNQAAIETIRRGYDLFVIVNSQSSSEIYQVGNMPVYSNTVASGHVAGQSVFMQGQTSIYGGQPIYDGYHNRELAVVMFRNGDPEGGNALDARAALGPDWQKKIKQTKNTCF